MWLELHFLGSAPPHHSLRDRNILLVHKLAALPEGLPYRSKKWKVFSYCVQSNFGGIMLTQKHQLKKTIYFIKRSHTFLVAVLSRMKRSSNGSQSRNDKNTLSWTPILSTLPGGMSSVCVGPSGFCNLLCFQGNRETSQYKHMLAHTLW